MKTRHGFLTDGAQNPQALGEAFPYQHSASVRGPRTLRFYRNLNLEACLWEFASYYDMSELLTDCGATVGTDGQVRLGHRFRLGETVGVVPSVDGDGFPTPPAWRRGPLGTRGQAARTGDGEAVSASRTKWQTCVCGRAPNLL